MLIGHGHVTTLSEETCELLTLFWHRRQCDAPEGKGEGLAAVSSVLSFLRCTCSHPLPAPRCPLFTKEFVAAPLPFLPTPERSKTSCLKTGLGIPSQPQGLLFVSHYRHFFTQQMPTCYTMQVHVPDAQ